MSDFSEHETMTSRAGITEGSGGDYHPEALGTQTDLASPNHWPSELVQGILPVVADTLRTDLGYLLRVSDTARLISIFDGLQLKLELCSLVDLSADECTGGHGIFYEWEGGRQDYLPFQSCDDVAAFLHEMRPQH